MRYLENVFSYKCLVKITYTNIFISGIILCTELFSHRIASPQLYKLQNR